MGHASGDKHFLVRVPSRNLGADSGQRHHHQADHSDSDRAVWDTWKCCPARDNLLESIATNRNPSADRQSSADRSRNAVAVSADVLAARYPSELRARVGGLQAGGVHRGWPANHVRFGTVRRQLRPVGGDRTAVQGTTQEYQCSGGHRALLAGGIRRGPSVCNLQKLSRTQLEQLSRNVLR
uniref:(northern house mosquito) hypothetical protein n=1 Tax=Culex pipiens TaxID=7175 RepID=A0A8D8FF46_CULPI